MDLNIPAPRRNVTRTLIYDTETTGMVLFKERHTDARQPHIVQLAWILVESGVDEPLASASHVFRLAPGVEVSKAAQATHGYSTDDCMRLGVDPAHALQQFLWAAERADVVAAHNEEFDRLVIRANAHRLGLDCSGFDDTPKRCTMREATEPVGILVNGRAKWPTLAQAYEHVTGREIEGAHDALADVLACRVVMDWLDAR